MPGLCYGWQLDLLADSDGRGVGASLAADALGAARGAAAWRAGLSRSERRFHPGPVPLLGGVAVYVALIAGLIAALLAGPLPPCRAGQTLLGADPHRSPGLPLRGIDDCRNLRWRAKLVLQFVAAMSDRRRRLFRRFHHRLRLPHRTGLLGVPLTTFWLMGCINALNLIDGLDGLASVVGLSTTSMMGIIALNMGNGHVAAAAWR